MKGRHEKKILFVRKSEHRECLGKLSLRMCLFGLLLRPPMTEVNQLSNSSSEFQPHVLCFFVSAMDMWMGLLDYLQSKKSAS